MKTERKMILAGGSGFLGRVLERYFSERGWRVHVLTRHPVEPNDVHWDGETLENWVSLLEGADAVINLAGRSVNCRYNARNREEIMNSRTRPTRVLGEAIAQCKIAPRVWLNSSTATIYKHTFGAAHDENGEIGATVEARDAFSIEVANAWERVFNEAPASRTRKIILRSAMVLGHARNSVFPTLRRLTRLGLGGRMGSGKQWVSWIHQIDFCRAVEFLIERPDLSGVFNLAAPNPVTNSEMMRRFREMGGAPFGLPATTWMLSIGALLLGTETELILKSRRVVSSRLMKAAFNFQLPEMSSALKDLESRSTGL